MDAQTVDTLALINAGVTWLIYGIFLTRIVQKSSLGISPVWAWIPIGNVWLIAQLGHVSFWWVFLKALVASVVVSLLTYFLALQTESLEVLVLGQVLTSMAAAFFVWRPAIEEGQLNNAPLMALAMGIPIINLLVLANVSNKGNWS